MQKETMLKEFAIKTAKKAGSFLLKHFKKDSSLIGKRGLSKEITTMYDLESDKIIVNAIKTKYPEHSIIAEESGDDIKPGKYTWIIDSLDGSSNYANGNPFFAVSIALMKENELYLGVIYSPALGELYFAQKGKGAFLNNKRIHTSKTDSTSNAYVVTCEGGEKNTKRITKLYSNILPYVKDMRKLGSAANELGFVASGRADAYVTLNIFNYDVAAGILLVREAGGRATDYKGKPWDAKQADLIASNKKLHDEILNKAKNKI